MTAGPTWAPVDPVRVLTNISSGEMGSQLVDELSKAKVKVDFLFGPIIHRPLKKPRIGIQIQTYDEFKNALLRQLDSRIYDAIIHAAAVSDFQPKDIAQEKIDSRKKSLTIHLIPTKKLIEEIKKRQPRTKLVGFKLCDRLRGVSQLQGVIDLLRKAHCDLIVANTMRNNQYRGVLIDKNQQIICRAKSRRKMIHHLLKELKDLL